MFFKMWIPSDEVAKVRPVDVLWQEMYVWYCTILVAGLDLSTEYIDGSNLLMYSPESTICIREAALNFASRLTIESRY